MSEEHKHQRYAGWGAGNYRVGLLPMNRVSISSPDGRTYEFDIDLLYSGERQFSIPQRLARYIVSLVNSFPIARARKMVGVASDRAVLYEGAVDIDETECLLMLPVQEYTYNSMSMAVQPISLRLMPIHSEGDIELASQSTTQSRLSISDPSPGRVMGLSRGIGRSLQGYEESMNEESDTIFKSGPIRTRLQVIGHRTCLPTMESAQRRATEGSL